MVRPAPTRQLGVILTLCFALVACGSDDPTTSDNGSTPSSATDTAPTPERATSEPVATSTAPASSLDHCAGAHHLVEQWVAYIFDVGEGADGRPRLDAVLGALAVQAQTAPAEVRLAHENALSALTLHGEMLEEAAWDATALSPDQHDALRQFDIDGVDPLEVVGEHYRESCGIDVDAYAEEVYAARYGEELDP